MLNAVKLAADDMGVAETCKRADRSDHDAVGTCIQTHYSWQSRQS